MRNQDEMSIGWRVNPSMQTKTRSKDELERLAEKMLREIKEKGHAKNLADLADNIKSNKGWQNVITETATGVINVLLSLGGTINEFEDIFWNIHKSHFVDHNDFIDNETQEIKRGRLLRHIKYMAGYYKDKPKNGFIFACPEPLENLQDDVYFEVIGTWPKNHDRVNLFSGFSKNVTTKEKIHLNGYIPTQEDFKKACQKLISKKNAEVNIDDILNRIHKDCQEVGCLLTENWREVTRRNIIEQWTKR
ncbi:hypothetical protein PITCH_A1470003 [uncultured Desulfobacterium sp.]|uniref:Uncharacterized protein n=1 Tax=uncultured Desulfobacterium sp. TaxID=201089 RepID=A0A445MSY9_9BACT|nr:hypothetical protein PITCH_A1470003 [uncultured Desulfobacterium sp.]